jgi:hypothetical protein
VGVLRTPVIGFVALRATKITARFCEPPGLVPAHPTSQKKWSPLQIRGDHFF